MVDEYDFDKGENEFNPPEAATKEEFLDYTFKLTENSIARNGNYNVSAFPLTNGRLEVLHSTISPNKEDDQLPIAVTHITEQIQDGRTAHSVCSIYRGKDKVVTMEEYTLPRRLDEKPIQEVKPTDVALRELNYDLKGLYTAVILHEKK